MVNKIYKVVQNSRNVVVELRRFTPVEVFISFSLLFFVELNFKN